MTLADMALQAYAQSQKDDREFRHIADKAARAEAIKTYKEVEAHLLLMGGSDFKFLPYSSLDPQASSTSDVCFLVVDHTMEIKAMVHRVYDSNRALKSTTFEFWVLVGRLGTPAGQRYQKFVSLEDLGKVLIEAEAGLYEGDGDGNRTADKR